MNILTFDIEEWYIEKVYHGGRRAQYDIYNAYLNRILDALDSANTKATFFCLGKIAAEFPYVVKMISERGHEIGCHSNEHLWLTKMSYNQIVADTRDAIHSLEDVSSHKVVSYRAPAFSIGEKNKWAIEVLAECGIERDASIFPAKRDFGGFQSFTADFPVLVYSNGSCVKEFPICMANLWGMKFAYSGGGYFRFFPYLYVKHKIERSNFTIAYFHIGDLMHNTSGVMSRADYELYFKEEGTLSNRLKRYVKSNIGTSTAFDKMSKLIGSCNFISLEEANNIIDWEKQKQITL